MAQLTQEQKRMVDEAIASVGPYGQVLIVVDSDAVTDIEGNKSTAYLKGGKTVRRLKPKD